MTAEIILNGQIFLLLCFVGISSSAFVDVNHTSAHPKGLIIVPENLRTSTLNVTFNETVQNDNAVVMCNVVESGNGLTKILLQNTTALIGQREAVIKFSILSPGQPVTVQCLAQSDGNSTQFMFSTSKGKPGYLQVTKAPIVTICSDPVLVATDRTCQTIQVELSETVSGQFPAVVNCSVIGTNNGPQFRFEPTVIDVGKRTAQVPYVTVSSGSQSQSARISCTAQTYNVTKLPTIVICGKGPVTSTTTPPPTTAPAASNITTTSATDSIPTPAPPEEILVPQFLTSQDGVDFFQYLTENSPDTPVTFTLNPLTLRFYPQTTSIHGSYSIILTLNTPQTIPLDILCSLTSLPPGSINSSYIFCPSEANDAVTLASSVVQLKLAATEIQFRKSEVSKTLSLSVTGSPTSRVRDLVQLSCCPKATSVLKPSPVGAFLWVDLSKQQPVDTNSGGSTSTSSLDIDLTCQCNLKEKQCDTGCCCDQDCSSNEKSSFSCTKGFFGGDALERPLEFSCEAAWPDSVDVNPFLCVAISNSPFIGYWFNYTSPTTAKDLPEYNTLLGAAKTARFSYQTNAQPSSPTVSTYKVGTTIKTAANSNDNQYRGASLGILSLPREVFSGLCSQNAPLRFLENLDSSCTTELTESLCTASSSLSASSFLMSKQMSSPPCPVPAAVLRKGALGQTQNEPPTLADMEMQYFCTNDSSKFVAVKSGPGSGVESDRPESSIWRCGFDDGKVAPPLPVFNSTSKICSNVVLNVTYQFETHGQEISKVKASITLGNIQIHSPLSSSVSSIASTDTPINTITQFFATKFIHSSSFNTSGGSPPDTVSRSGNPGYIKGLPVLGLKRTQDNSSLSQLPIRSPSVDSLCSSSTLSIPILFGEALTSGCLMKLGFSDMRNCTRVRELVRTNHEALLKATHVGRTGNARASVDEDWLPIIRDEIKDSPSTTNSTITGECRDIPQVQLIQVLVSQAGVYRGVPQMEVVGLRISYEYTTWRYQCVSGYGLSCLATPVPGSNATLNNTGASQNASSVNSTITPTATVSLVVSSSAVLNGSSVRQQNQTTNSSYSPRQMVFMLETSVVFITVPATQPVKMKRSSDQTGICYKDVCKEELFYPLSPAYQGESKDKVMAYSLILIFLTLIVFVCTKPWG